MNNNTCIDLIIVGGGLAGLVSAIHLSKQGIEVLVIEKNTYPRHKVCGEYVSNEVLPYLQSLGVDPLKLGAKKINRFMLSTPKNKVIETQLPLGGFGISRYTLDHALVQKSKENGAIIIQDTVTDIKFLDDEFSIITKNGGSYKAKVVIGAHGKRSNIDVTLNRNFIKNKSPLLAVKTHLKGDFPDDLVALHNFKGGYCGLSKVENDSINVCYIADFKSFQKFKNIQDFQQKILYKNTYLKNVFENSEPVFSKPLTISQLSFSSKKPVEQHVLMCGDSAGMIHPLSGNGMSMAIRSAQMLSKLLINYFAGTIKSREMLEIMYEKTWNNEFKKRLKTGHIVASLFKMDYFSELMLLGLKNFPGLLPKIIKQAHGKPLIV
ncbi:MAG: NAD(P)/FAD-dependent oxidoreductase [Flavobacteriaceae bacterium]|nr:NAD(P)/FAD-dependent oxidoreductase [Flavobacteriaceae bacterium]